MVTSRLEAEKTANWKLEIEHYRDICNVWGSG